MKGTKGDNTRRLIGVAVLMVGLCMTLTQCGTGEISEPASGMKVVSSVSQARITGFAQDASGYIWMRTAQDGVFRYNGQNYIHYTWAGQDSRSIQADMVNDMMADSKGRLWLATQKGADLFNPSIGGFDHIQIDDVNQYAIYLFEFPDQTPGLITRRGIFAYDQDENKFKLRTQLSEVNVNPSEMLPEMRSAVAQSMARTRQSTEGFTDNRGNKWYAQSQGGWKIQLNSSDRYNGQVPGGTTTQTWLNQRYNGQGADGTTSTYILNKVSGLQYQMPQIQALPGNRILVSERGVPASIIRLGGENMGELEAVTVSDYNMYLAGADENGKIWAVADGGIILSATLQHSDATMQHSDATLQHHGKTLKLEDTGLRAPTDISYATFVRTLRDGRIMVLLTDNHPLLLDPLSSTLTDLFPSEGTHQVYYSSMLEDRDGNVWMGTTDWGLYLYSPSGKKTKKIDELGKSPIYGICQESSGRMFINTREGVYTIEGETIKPVWMDMSEITSLRPMFEQNGSVYLVLADEKTINLSSNSQNQDRRIEQPVNVIITQKGKILADVRSDNSQVWPLKIRVDADARNDLNMELSVVDYSGTYIYDYRYEVNNFHGEMRQSVNNPDIPLYGLKFGNNTIKFNIQSTNDMSSTGQYVINLNVRRPVYQIVIIAVFIGLILLLTISMWILRKRKADAEKARKERELQEEINMKNIDFFANISHEFRAPLTLINAATSGLQPTNPEQKRMFGVIQRNTNRMLKLVGQMLDFNKLDHDMLKLAVRQEDIPSIVNRVAENFSAGAAQKSISLITEGCQEPLTGWIDSDKLEKVLYNLCSNAMKFTAPGGTITIKMEKVGSSATNSVIISVTDTGIGLQEDRIDTLFTRFAQLESVKKSGGTGIGLYYAKSLVELHHGNIKAENCYENEKVTGAKFTFELPISRAEYSEDELNPQPDTNIALDPIMQQNEFKPATNSTENQADKPTVLLIDDDYEFIYYLRSVLANDYNVQFRFDAMGGYNIIEQTEPDVIISDIMMIDVDGLQLCRMIKENIAMCHIPVIMLTGRSTVEDQINSLNVGADAYVIKPFNPDYLKALIRSMIENRTRIRSLLTNSTSTSDIFEADATNATLRTEAAENAEKHDEQAEKVYDLLGPKDRAFMDKLYELMENNIEHGELDIDNLAQELGVSRSKFYYKLKNLTGQTPNEFFNTYKLNRAIKLIEEGKYKISAIANMVGFNSSSHFAQLFKKRFGVLPSQWENHTPEE